ncbi:hypothetical protein OF83DRAFT_1134442 [Amylostereum chailletii]|nr:hypothetical protein OF83DRAFT_1134442 [Amylostereum chailletii]
MRLLVLSLSAVISWQSPSFPSDVLATGTPYIKNRPTFRLPRSHHPPCTLADFKPRQETWNPHGAFFFLHDTNIGVPSRLTPQAQRSPMWPLHNMFSSTVFVSPPLYHGCRRINRKRQGQRGNLDLRGCSSAHGPPLY